MNGQKPIPVDLNKMPNGQCPHCNGAYFTIVFLIKKINKMLIGAPEDQFIKVECWQCVDCNTVVLSHDAKTLFPENPNKLIHLGGN